MKAYMWFVSWTRAAWIGPWPHERVISAAPLAPSGLMMAPVFSPVLVAAKMARGVVDSGCGVAETYPASFVPTEDWELDDPEGKSLEEVRKIRDEIKARVAALVKELG